MSIFNLLLFCRVIDQKPRMDGQQPHQNNAILTLEAPVPWSCVLVWVCKCLEVDTSISH